MKKRILNEKAGITLIALIITIIILLILAGITIGMLTGENGILTRATQAKENYQREAAREKVEIAVLNYQVNQENTTLYDELRKIEGLISITPDNAQEGPPYTLIVDGYEFMVNDDLTVSGGEKVKIKYAPKIKEIKYETKKTQAPLPVTITAVTEDEEGINQIKVSYINKEEEPIKYEDLPIENEGNVAGKEVEITVQIPANGEYMIQVIGKNGTITKQEITINNLYADTLLATITKGSVIDNHVALTITATATELPINTMELYVDGTKIEAVEYTTNEEMNKEATYTINNMEFYKEYACYVKVSNTRGKEVTSATINTVNTTAIATATDLKNLAIQVNEKGNTFGARTIQLIADIDLNTPNTKPWKPIGTTQNYFAGKFNGNRHTISNLYINIDRGAYIGLFGVIDTMYINDYATISNLTISSGSINAVGFGGGAIVGLCKKGKIENCVNHASITGDRYIGGIVGHVQEETIIERCGNVGMIIGNENVGGIVGTISTSEVKSCYNKGTIKAQVYRGGGIIGYSKATSILYNYNTANIEGGYQLGGIVGFGKTRSSIRCCYNKGTITAVTKGPDGHTNVGGIAGVVKESGEIYYCYNLGIVQMSSGGGTRAGGIVGIILTNDMQNPNANNASNIRYCYNAATVIAQDMYAGGIAGEAHNYCSVKNCYVASNLRVQAKGKTATGNRGQGPDFVGKIVGNLGIVSGEYLGDNTNDITVCVYYVVNQHSSGSSSYWSNSNVNQPKLIWE